MLNRLGVDNMARIIKRGVKARPVFRGTCHSCGCVAEEDREVLNVQHDRNESLASITCPQCDKQMWVYPYSELARRDIVIDDPQNWKSGRR